MDEHHLDLWKPPPLLSCRVIIQRRVFAAHSSGPEGRVTTRKKTQWATNMSLWCIPNRHLFVCLFVLFCCFCFSNKAPALMYHRLASNYPCRRMTSNSLSWLCLSSTGIYRHVCFMQCWGPSSGSYIRQASTFPTDLSYSPAQGTITLIYNGDGIIYNIIVLP